MNAPVAHERAVRVSQWTTRGRFFPSCARGVAVLLIERRLALAPGLADCAAAMGHGRIVFGGTPREVATRDDAVREGLGIG